MLMSLDGTNDDHSERESGEGQHVPCKSTRTRYASPFDPLVVPFSPARGDNCGRTRQKEKGAAASDSLRLSCYWGMANLSRLKGFPDLKQLEIVDCIDLVTLSGVEHCKRLRILGIARCKKLEDVSELRACDSLENLIICGCERLGTVAGVEGMAKLSCLKISQCGMLAEVNLDDTLRLRRVIIEECWALREVLVHGCVKLESLALLECSRLRSLRGLFDLHSLVSLNFEGCVSLREVGSLTRRNKLERLNIGNCTMLTDMGFLDRCTKIKKLVVFGTSVGEGVKEKLRSKGVLVVDDDQLDEYYHRYEQRRGRSANAEYPQHWDASLDEDFTSPR